MQSEPSAVSTASGAAGGLVDSAVQAISDVTTLSPEVARELLYSALAVLALWALRLAVLRVVNQRVEDVKVRYQWRKTSLYVAVFVGALLFLRIWLGALGSLATFFGLVAAGLAIALKDPLVNMAGWVFILWKRPLSPGDRVSIRDLTGDVIDQRVFAFTLLEVGTKMGAGQSTGRIIHVPNGWVFTSSVLNHTGAFAYVWNEIGVVVTFESDWRATKALLHEIAAEHAGVLSEDAERTLRRAAQRYLIFYSKLTPTVYTDVLDSGVRLTLRYLVEPRRVRGSEQNIWEAILDAIHDRPEIDLAYPTQRVIHSPMPPAAPEASGDGARVQGIPRAE